jgi:translin
MLNKKEFEAIRKELNEFEVKREETISNSREVITLSKQIIYSVHRNELDAAGKLLKNIKAKINKLDAKKNYDTGISSVAFQEYVEAIVFFEVVKNGTFPSMKQLQVDVESYLSGLADLTGELGRKAVHDAIKKDFKSVLKVKEVVEDIYGEFLKFDLRNGELRKKSDAIKWNLNKLEDLVLALNLNRRIE